MPFGDRRDFTNAQRGFMGRREPAAVHADDGTVVWDNDRYAFLAEDAPETVHPSLWRQSQLNSTQGLYEVVEGIYQVRGFDLSNVTFVEGDTGVIIIDPLTCVETAGAAFELYRQHRGERAVRAVIYTHSHADHFGGVKGVTTQAEVDSGDVAVIAPEGFTEHAVAENVYAGTAMARRAAYMFGAALDRGPKGQVGAGLGQTVPTGEFTLIVPTIDITSTGQTLTVDGVEIEFQLAPGTEAPAEMHFYFPRYRALCMAENANHTLHNLLTLRGALVRDPRIWAQYLTEAIEIFSDRADVEFSSHHWPTWGRDEIVEFLSTQRDLYAYLHDQTLRMLNRGLNGPEIAEQITLPPALENAWNARGYYGSVSHNVKAIYQRYMGWFDGNPARLWQHVPEQAAVRYVAAMGGIDAVIALARTAYDDGDFRWAATLLDHAVFADPAHEEAKGLLAATFDQLGYGAENGVWRNFFLSGAAELRGRNFGTPTVATSPDVLGQISVEQFFDVIAIQVDGPKAWDLDVVIDWTFKDLSRNYRTTLRNGVFITVQKPAASDADATVTLTKAVLPLFFTSPAAAAAAGAVLEGDTEALDALFSVLQPGDPSFPIVTP